MLKASAAGGNGRISSTLLVQGFELFVQHAQQHRGVQSFQGAKPPGLNFHF